MINTQNVSKQLKSAHRHFSSPLLTIEFPIKFELRNGRAPAREAATSRFRCRAFRNGVLRRNPAVLAFVNATSPGMLLAATALTPLPPPSQDCISALIVQVGATGAAEQQAELSLAGRGWYQERFMREKVLPACMRETAESQTNRSRISSGTA